MPAPGSFQAVLSAAIDDMLANGFDSAERVAKWTRALEHAAAASLVSAASLDQMLRDGLAAVYRRMVDKGGVVKFNPCIERFTIEKLKPKLRAELDRRIMASADLIKLNRKQAIDKTLQRFQGWSTSIPAGGSTVESRAKVKVDVKKSLAQLPFAERRCLIDQGHKLAASISEVVANDGGAIAGQWASRWRQPGYNYREDHKERDKQVYLIRDSWAHRAGLVKKGAPGFVDEITRPAEEPFCRCSYVYLFALRDLPDDMLTQKGRRALVDVGMADPNRAFARADSEPSRSSYANPAHHDMAREIAEMTLIADFLDENLRQPTEAERADLMETAGRRINRRAVA
jgi:hypothetical protein